MKTRTRALAALCLTTVVAAGCFPPEPGGGTPDDPLGRYVATTGVDTGTCSASAAPCLTINYAISQANPGDNVYVAAGSYAEIAAPDKDLDFKGANAGVAAGTAPGARGAESVVQGFRNPGNPGTTSFTISIDGFRIDPQGDAALLAASAQPLVWLRGGTTTVINNVFHGGTYQSDCSFTCTTMADYAFAVQSGDVTFSANTVENFRRPVNINQAVGAADTVATVSANTFTGITSRALSLSGSTGVQMPGQTVSGNTFDATGRTAPSAPAGITVSNGSNVIDGNSFTGFASGVFIDMCKKFITDDNSITNNDFVGNGGAVNITANSDGGQCSTSTTEGADGWVTGGGRVNGLVVTGNDFVGNTTYAVRHAAYNWGFFTATAPVTAGPVDLSCNYWSSTTGPGVAAYSYPPGTVTPIPDGLIHTASPEVQPAPTTWRTAVDGPCDGSA